MEACFLHFYIINLDSNPFQYKWDFNSPSRVKRVNVHIFFFYSNRKCGQPAQTCLMPYFSALSVPQQVRV